MLIRQVFHIFFTVLSEAPFLPRIGKSVLYGRAFFLAVSRATSAAVPRRDGRKEKQRIEGAPEREITTPFFHFRRFIDT